MIHFVLSLIFKDSFKPVVSFEKADDKLIGWVFRAICNFLLLTLVACVFGYIGYMLYTDDLSIKDVASGTSTGLNDIENWGRMYLGIDGPANQKKYNSFAEEMLLSGLNEETPEEQDEDDEDADLAKNITGENP